MRRMVTAEDWRRAARRRLPRVAFDFIDGGSDDEVTVRRNRAAFDDISFLPRLLGGVGPVSTELELYGRKLRLPVLLAPAGNARIAGPEGEMAQARGADHAGTIAVLSCGTSVATEQVAAAAGQPGWFQLYLYKDRDHTIETIARAKRLGFTALVLTADAPVAGRRERDIRHGMRVPLRITPGMYPGALLRPRWMWHYVTGPAITSHHRPAVLAGSSGPTTHADFATRMIHTAQDWEDLRWVRDQWPGPLLLKGVLSAEDASRALAVGCDGVIVSNHGGRQLDGAPATIEVLPEVVSAVAGRVPVLMDSGVRRGSDVLKALCLGATACLVGRPWFYALAVAGSEGVGQMLESFREEIVTSMPLLGVDRLAQLGPHLVRSRAVVSGPRATPAVEDVHAVD